jgi:uroporphyrinogen-III synthase
MAAKPPLANLTIIVTRPVHQAEPLCHSLQILGAKTILLPSLNIIGMTPKHNLSVLSKQDIVIFTSANAVMHGKPLLSALPKEGTYLAIGPGTAKTVKDLMQQDPIIPTQYSSEGLLNLTELQDVKGKTIYILCGKDPRSHLFDSLKARGADVIPIITYQRCAADLNDSTIDALKQPINPSCTITTSKHSLLQFHQTIVQKKLDWLLNQPLVITQTNQLHLAKQLGFEKILIAQNPSDEEIIRTLINKTPDIDR